MSIKMLKKDSDKLKVGDYIYKIVYYSNPFKIKSRRKLEKYKIKKITPKNIITYYGWKIHNDDIDLYKNWFISEKKAYKHSLELHKETYNTECKPIIQEIEYLKKKIKGV